jgi:hypothetical protein
MVDEERIIDAQVRLFSSTLIMSVKRSVAEIAEIAEIVLHCSDFLSVR